MKLLHQRLSAAMEPAQIFQATTWGNPRPMTAVLRDIKRAFGGNEVDLPTEDLLQVLMRKFAVKKEVASFIELKSVCYGITVPVSANHWRLIDRAPLVDNLIKQVEQLSAQPKQYRRCYQGLLHGYFGFDRNLEGSGVGRTNWNRLRGFLSENLQPIIHASASRGQIPDWLQVLAEHRNLLSEDPCTRYARALQNGLSDELKSLCTTLGISSTSWVWDDALMAYVHAVCEGGDLQFKRGMPGILDLVAGRSELRLAQMLSIRATGLTVSRYAKCTDRPEHTELRDTSIRLIGHPWVRKTAWDAHVNNEPARQMVEGWLNRQLIKDFFEVLAQDGSADLGRLNYWLKWEPQITEMWFVLGETARQNRSAEFQELRRRMEGRDRILDDINPDNNAFVMRIGPLLVIEFGLTGNACFVFAAADFKANLERKRFDTKGDLKQKEGRAGRLTHRPDWEGRFDLELRRLLQSVPHSRGQLRDSTPVISAVSPAGGQRMLPSPAKLRLDELPLESPRAGAGRATGVGSGAGVATKGRIPELSQVQAPLPRLVVPTTDASLKPTEAPSPTSRRKILTESNFYSVCERCIQHRVQWEDNRSRGGALWVLMPDRSRHLGFAAFLEGLGFQHTLGKGFWIKGGGSD